MRGTFLQALSQTLTNIDILRLPEQNKKFMSAVYVSIQSCQFCNTVSIKNYELQSRKQSSKISS